VRGLRPTIAVVSLWMYAVTGRTSATTDQAPKTPWGEPEICRAYGPGMSTSPSKRPAKYRQPGVLFGRRTRRVRSADCGHHPPGQHRKPPGSGTERDVNTEFSHGTFHRAICLSADEPSLIVDPPDGRNSPAHAGGSAAQGYVAGVPASPSSSHMKLARTSSPAALADTTDPCHRDERGRSGLFGRHQVAGNYTARMAQRTAASTSDAWAAPFRIL